MTKKDSSGIKDGLSLSTDFSINVKDSSKPEALKPKRTWSKIIVGNSTQKPILYQPKTKLGEIITFMVNPQERIEIKQTDGYGIDEPYPDNAPSGLALTLI